MSKIKLNNPIITAVINERKYVASTFSIQDLALKSPIIKSLAVLAMKGLVIFPLKESKAGIIIKRMRTLSNGKIRKVSTIPAKISPTMETISEGNVCLTILPFLSCVSIFHHQSPMIQDPYYQTFLLIVIRNHSYIKVLKIILIINFICNLYFTGNNPFYFSRKL